MGNHAKHLRKPTKNPLCTLVCPSLCILLSVMFCNLILIVFHDMHHNMNRKWHPDKNQGKSEAEQEEADRMFTMVAQAYAVLSDPDKRRYYDQVSLN